MDYRHMPIVWKSPVIAAFAALMLSAPGLLEAAKISDVTNTKHNLSTTASSATRTVVASSESQICVFCHTPHAATVGANPLWNRALSSASGYNMYGSNSVDAYDSGTAPSNPGGSSKLCLSCHDGTLALGMVNVANGQANAQIDFTTGAGNTVFMPGGTDGGATGGFTRNLGKVLTNDHPISFTYNDAVFTADDEIRPPSTTAHIGPRGAGNVPLEDWDGSEGELECISCHDPHIRDDGGEDIKFVRGNRFQKGNPSGSSYSANETTGDIICLACHNKLGSDWATSAHANNTDATEAYLDAAATLRDFPTGITVWEAACLNCHDTHTVQGARRLLREGTNSGVPSPKPGGTSAIEETCYQCHTTGGGILTAGAQVPDIETDFTSSTFTMPITRTFDIDPGGGVSLAEIHDIGTGSWTANVDRPGANMLESRERLGHAIAGDDPIANNALFDYRHAECTDCHNPHRVIKSQYFSGSGTSAGTHKHDSATVRHTNLISGVLKGSWGVEPVYGSESFFSVPTGFSVKKGVGSGTTPPVISTFVTREYQICLKCHSNYAYNDPDLTIATYNSTSNRPSLGAPGTPSGSTERTNFNVYTNQAREFQAPHPGETTADLGVEGGAHADFDADNHRSWHPVMAATGRTKTIRDMNTGGNQFRAPWNSNSNVGLQTMYCTDCHGSDTPGSQSVVPSGGDTGNNGLENSVDQAPWGPHGSTNRFILKGTYSGDGASTRDLCFKCHNPSTYNGGSNDGGFMHGDHIDKIEGDRLNCNWCHIAVPHGWKNKSLLVNLNDVGPEAGQAPGTGVNINGNADVYSNGPYYRNAKLKIRSFATAGNWSESNCGNQDRPVMINSTNGNSNNLGGGGGDWMTDTCENPP